MVAVNNAKGIVLEGLFISPVFTITDSKPPNANTSKSTAFEKDGSEKFWFALNRSVSKKNNPAIIKMANGINLATVRILLVRAIFFTPM